MPVRIFIYTHTPGLPPACTAGLDRDQSQKKLGKKTVSDTVLFPLVFPSTSSRTD